MFGLSCLHAPGCMADCNWTILSPTGGKKSERMGCSVRSRRGCGGRGAAQRPKAMAMGPVTSSMRSLYRGRALLSPHSTRRGGNHLLPQEAGGKWLWLRWRRYCGAVVRKLFVGRSLFWAAAAPARGRPREGKLQRKAT